MTSKINQKFPAMMATQLMMILLSGFSSGSSLAVQGKAAVLGQVRFETGPARESIVYLLRMLLTRALLDGLDQDIRALGPPRSGSTIVVPKENRR